MFNDGASKHSVMNRGRNPTAGDVERKGDKGVMRERKKQREFLSTFDLRRVTGSFARGRVSMYWLCECVLVSECLCDCGLILSDTGQTRNAIAVPLH